MNLIKTILIPDVDNRFATETALCLKKEFKHIKIIGCDSTSQSKSQYSRFIDKVIFLDEKLTVKHLKRLVSEHSIDLIFPVATRGIKFCSSNQSLIKEFCLLMPVPTEETLAITADKYCLSQFLKETSINHPETQLLNEIATFNETVLIKPRAGADGENIHKIENGDQLIQYKKRYQQHICQEFIKGYDIDCSVFCIDGKIKNYTIQRAKQEGGGYAPDYSVLTFLHDERLLSLVTELMEGLKWNGIAHIDLRYADTGKLFLIEINPRYWGSMLGSLSAGINFPCRVFDYCNGTKVTEKSDYTEINYLSAKYMYKFYGVKKLKFQLPYLINDPLLSIARLLKLR